MCGWAGTLVGVPRPVHIFSINHQSPILIVEISTKMGFEARRHAAVAIVSNVSVVSVVSVVAMVISWVFRLGHLGRDMDEVLSERERAVQTDSSNNRTSNMWRGNGRRKRSIR